MTDDTATPVPRPGAATVLVVDDDPMIREVVRAALEGEGLAVETAADGAAAVAQVRALPPDLVLSDVEMPELDGFGLVAALREDPATRAVPLLLLTSRTQPADVLRGLALGADDYVHKPFDVVELVARVQARLVRRPVPREEVGVDARSGLLLREELRGRVAAEVARARSARRPGALMVLTPLGDASSERSGPARATADALGAVRRPDEVAGWDGDGVLTLLVPDVDATAAQVRAEEVVGALGTPGSGGVALGWVGFGGREGAGVPEVDRLWERALAAAAVAATEGAGTERAGSRGKGTEGRGTEGREPGGGGPVRWRPEHGPRRVDLASDGARTHRRRRPFWARFLTRS